MQLPTRPFKYIYNAHAVLERWVGGHGTNKHTNTTNIKQKQTLYLVNFRIGEKRFHSR